MARITISQLAKLCRRIGTGVDAGLDDRSLWRRETERGTPEHRRRIAPVADRLDRGDSVADSLAAADDYFPDLFIEMVRMSERSGRQGAVYRRLAEHYEHLIALRNSFLGMLWWPLLELTAAVVVIGLLILVLGWVASWTGTPPIDLFGLGLSPNGNFALYAFGVLVVVGSISSVILGLARGWFGAAPTALAMRVPVLGQTLRLMGLSRMAWSFGMAIDSGMPAQACMQLGLASSQNAYFRSLEPQICGAIAGGAEFHQALARTAAFPDDFVDAVEAGELSGTVTETLERLSDDYRSRAENLFKFVTVVGGFIVMAIVGLVIAAAIILLYKRLIIDQYQELLQM
ncbi:MAG TPA: hypothetical protein DCQ98_12315 [Planctomycetaceae bacterium]|nr:hypothetical protein [Planctomycetaceae bacterium]HRF01952.1 type II secretion system F family protein [Pirellulaceae bacterium]